MHQHSQDLVLSIFCALGSYFLLSSSGWTILSYFALATLIYFLIKLKEPEKLNVNDDFMVCIVGSGISGICMGKKLNDIGIKYVILEKASTMGGTWWENQYPGIACDVPSHLYSFSFYTNPSWSKEYSPGKEIRGYLNEVASYFNVFPKMQFNKKVLSAEWLQKSGKWQIATDDGSKIFANVLITATGQLHVPNVPEFPGIDDFSGEAFHTAHWKTDYDPKGKSIGIIGTGASAVQAVPSLANQAIKSLTVFQRTACWSFPRFEFYFSKHAIFVFKYIPFVEKLLRCLIFWRQELLFWILFCKPNFITKWLSDTIHSLARKWYFMKVKDPELIDKLMPKFPMGSKRVTPSDEYIASYNKPNVNLVTDKLDTFTKDGIRTVDGKEYKFDTVLLATGFNMIENANPFKIIGKDGKQLKEIFGDTPMAYMGCTHSSLPNFYFLNGPGTGLGHSSMIYMIECQADYAIEGIKKMVKLRAKSFTLKEDRLMAYWDWSQAQMKDLVFGSHSLVSGWYRNERGVNWTLYPAGLVRFWWTTKDFNLLEYKIVY